MSGTLAGGRGSRGALQECGNNVDVVYIYQWHRQPFGAGDGLFSWCPPGSWVLQVLQLLGMGVAERLSVVVLRIFVCTSRRPKQASTARQAVQFASHQPVAAQCWWTPWWTPSASEEKNGLALVELTR